MKYTEMPCAGKCDICERGGIVYPICACKQAHAKCFTKGTCVLCEEEFYLPTWTDLFYIAIIIMTALGSIVVHHL